MLMKMTETMKIFLKKHLRKKGDITVFNESRLKKSQVRIVKGDDNYFKNMLRVSITELNDLVYAGAKLVRYNIFTLQKNANISAKPEWEIGLEGKLIYEENK